jgi:SAM-dependent methyltransferase
MDEPTAQYLNSLNRDFYRVTAAEFDQTRGQPWPGWEPLLPLIHTPLTVLDVGCGNGRFGLYLAQHLEQVNYHGIDNNAALLARAQENLPDATFSQVDIIEHPPDSGTYDLVVLFGVIHHVPGEQRRRDFIRILADRVASGGYLAFACWRFYEFERFRGRIVPWPEDVAVEAHDYLLDWRRGERALRYCHYVDDEEHTTLVAATGLDEITTYRADGFSGTVNCYSILQRSS